jgi:hypothetical protein
MTIAAEMIAAMRAATPALATLLQIRGDRGPPRVSATAQQIIYGLGQTQVQALAHQPSQISVRFCDRFLEHGEYNGKLSGYRVSGD